MVVKDVDEDTTMVGIPAREVLEKTPPVVKDHHFEAYGTPQDEEIDPVVAVLDKLRNDVANLRMRVAPNWKLENSELARKRAKNEKQNDKIT